MEGNKQNLLQHTLIDCCSWEPTCCISHTRYRQGAYLLPLALSQIQAGWWDRENIVRNQSVCQKQRESRPLPGDSSGVPCRGQLLPAPQGRASADPLQCGLRPSAEQLALIKGKNKTHTKTTQTNQTNRSLLTQKSFLQFSEY